MSLKTVCLMSQVTKREKMSKSREGSKDGEDEEDDDEQGAQVDVLFVSFVL
jgi:hypothetical protein